MKTSFYDMEKDGVTQSLIAMWLSCREKARLYLEGWDSKYHKETLIDGNIGHGVFELAYTDIKEGKLKTIPTMQQTKKYVAEAEKRWYAENLKASAEARVMVERACAVMEVMLPLYFDFWKDDFTKKEWLSLEEKILMKFPISTGTDKQVTIPIRGKKDGTFMGSKGIWLFETKFKSQIDEVGLLDTLSFETQVMMYLLQTWGNTKNPPPRGCLYNVVRRASLRQKVKESIPAFAARVKKDIEKRPEFYFLRLHSPTTTKDLLQFRKELSGILEDMWGWWNSKVPNYKNTYSCIGKYGRCLFLPVCGKGDYSSLAKRKVVFKELEEA